MGTVFTNHGATSKYRLLGNSDNTIRRRAYLKKYGSTHIAYRILSSLVPLCVFTVGGALADSAAPPRLVSVSSSSFPASRWGLPAQEELALPAFCHLLASVKFNAHVKKAVIAASNLGEPPLHYSAGQWLARFRLSMRKVIDFEAARHPEELAFFMDRARRSASTSPQMLRTSSSPDRQRSMETLPLILTMVTSIQP